MAWYRAGGGGIPSSLKTDMNDVLNKKFGTSQDYPPTDWAPTVNLMGPLPEKTASGAIVTFSDGADEVPIKSWEVEIAPTLTGKSAVECTQTWKNMLNPATCQRGYIEGGGGIHVPQAYQELYSDYIKVKPNITYTFSGTVNNSSDKWCGIAYYDKDKNFIIRQAVTTGTGEDFSIGYVTPSNAVYVRCTWRNYSNIDSGGTVCPCQFEEGTKTNYEAYDGTTSTVNLGRTIHGGTADVISGEGESTEKGKWLSELTWTQNTSYPHIFNGEGFTDRKKNFNWDNTTCLSDRYTGYTSSSIVTQSSGIALGTGATSTRIYVSDDRFETVADFVASLQSDDSFVVLPLETPETFTFTPITPTPETALGTNNFWADEGDSSVTYRADINLALGGQ